MERQLFTKSPVKISPIELGAKGLRLASSVFWLAIAGGAGYLGAEINRVNNLPNTQVSSDNIPYPLYSDASLDPETRALVNDLRDRLGLHSQKNEQIYGRLTNIALNQERRIAAIEERTGMYIIPPTPRPRPTISERLKPGAKP